MTKEAEPPVDERIIQVLRHLGIARPTSWASSPCPASLVTVILANSVSQETGSDSEET